jgi:hypothetical protein
VILLSSFPIQFFRTDQMEKSLRLNIGTGSSCLKTPKNAQLLITYSNYCLFSGQSKQKKKRNWKRFTAEIDYKLPLLCYITNNIWLWMAQST